MASPTETDLDLAPRLFFTAPWDPVVVRRGDALGLRALADQLADAVAPGLSNRVRDGRWVTILSWCLARSQEVFHASRGRSVTTRAEQRERYAWLRPLELMWVARTIALADDWKERSLSGQRRVRPWYEDDNQLPPRFGMSIDQFRAYRQTGMYGGYRLAFRKWPGMTVLGDGWTPGPVTNRLASWLDGNLGAARPGWPVHQAADHDDSPLGRVPKLGSGDKHDWWLRHWPKFALGGRNADERTLPRRKDDVAVLPERDLLKPVIFGQDVDGKRRLDVAREVAKAGADDHAALCEHLGEVFGNVRAVALLPRFARLADAGMEAMDLIADALAGSSRVSLSEVAARADAADTCEELMAAAQAWRRDAEMQVRHVETAHRFASAIPSARPLECLRAVLEHHETYGGGLRWFVLRNGKVEPRTPPRAGSSRYRFRLWSLCRLAVQCGVLRAMPAALADEERLEVELEEDFDD
jgi:hypothetical protein